MTPVHGGVVAAPAGGRPWQAPASAFLLTAGLGLLLSFGLVGLPDQGALQGVWLVLGGAVGIAFRFEPRFLPSVAAGLVVAAVIYLLSSGWPVVATGTTTALVVAALIGVVVPIRDFGGARLERATDLRLLLGVVGAVAVVSAVPAYVLGRVLGPGLSGFTPLAWLIGLSWGFVAVAPFVITVRRPPRRLPPSHVVEFLLAVGLTLVAAVYTFALVTAGSPGLFGWPYLVIVGLMLVAIRFDVAVLAPTASVVAWYTAVQTVNGQGAFVAGGSDPISWLMVVQLFTVVILTAVLLLALLTGDRRRAFEELQRTSQYVRQVLDASQSRIYAKSYAQGEGRYILTNRSWAQASGVPAGSGEGATDVELFGPEVGRARRRDDHAVLAANTALTFEQAVHRGRRGKEVLLTTRFPLRDRNGAAWGVGGIATDVTRLAQAQERERRQSDRLQAVFTVSPTPSMRIAAGADGVLQVLFVNQALRTLTGHAPEDLDDSQGPDFLQFVEPDDRDTARKSVADACRLGREALAGTLAQHEIRLRGKDGPPRWVLLSAAAVGLVDDAGTQEVVLQFTDITGRKEAERALRELARHDPVTGLPNRHALLDRIEAALDRLRRSPGVVCVLFCDLDQFKHVNDTLGHHVGDQLLVEVAGRIRAATRADDTVARLGGDEFVVVYERLADPMDAVLLAMRLQEAVRTPWEYGDQVFRPAMSVGVASTTSPETSIDDLLRRADLAMYQAKDAGRDRVQLYDRSLGQAMKRTVAVQQRLRAAVDRDDLILHYQPIVNLRDNGVVGAEALLRMRGPRGRVIPPGDFIPHAETSGLIGPVGAWVLQRALRDLRARHDLGRRQSVSINVSPAQLRRPGFGDLLLGQAAAQGVTPDWVIVEVTETALIRDREHVAEILAQLHAAGVSIALDDFGTGYSSLSWLTQFPVDLVKIDRTFTAQLGRDARRTAVVAAVIAVAEELGLTVIAEGVETVEQRDRLLDLECPLAQGFLLGRPVPADDASWQ